MLPLNVFDRLIEAETTNPGQSALVAGLTEKWEVSEDGLTYTFHLRQGVKFHDGADLTADDVVYTFDRMLNPATQALGTDILDFVDGAKERPDGTADMVRGLKAVDKYTVEIHLTQPYAAFATLMASPQASIFNRAFTEAAGDQFGQTPETTNGTGPFNPEGLCAERQPDAGGERKLFPWPPQAGQHPCAGGVGCRNPAAAVRDWRNRRLRPGLRRDPEPPYFYGSDQWKDQIRSGPRVGMYYYHISQAIKPFDDVKVRKAFQMSINREQILDKNFYGKGKVENGVMLRGLTCYEPATPIGHNPQKAKELLAEAGYPDDVEIALAQVSGLVVEMVRHEPDHPGAGSRGRHYRQDRHHGPDPPISPSAKAAPSTPMPNHDRPTSTTPTTSSTPSSRNPAPRCAASTTTIRRSSPTSKKARGMTDPAARVRAL